MLGKIKNIAFVVALVGLVTAYVLYVRFFGANTPVVVPWTGEAPVAGSEVFMESVARAASTTVKSAEPVTVIQGGADFETILLRDIRQATSSILITDYAWNDGQFSAHVFAALEEAARRGVAVRVILDGFAEKVSPQAVSDLKAAGGKVISYHPFDWQHPFTYNIRDHARLFVIDGATGFTGGIGLVDYWTGTAEGFTTWRDLMFGVHGAMARDLGRDFEALWRASTPTPLGISFDPPRIMRVPMSAGTTTRRYISPRDIPSTSFQPIHSVLLLSVLAAKKSLYIECPFIVPDRDFLQALETRARAGVDVRLVTPGPITIAPILRSAWHGDYDELLSAGIKLYEYQPSMIHSKFVVVDGVWSVIGSANIDDRSESINAESVFGVADPALAGQLEGIFNADQSNSKEVTLDGWHSTYGFFDRLKSRFWLIFARQL